MSDWMHEDGVIRAADYHLVVCARHVENAGPDEDNLIIEVQHPPGQEAWSMQVLFEVAQRIGAEGGYNLVGLEHTTPEGIARAQAALRHPNEVNPFGVPLR